MSWEDVDYYRKRSIAELELACVATDEVAALRHAELALRYQALQEKAEGRTPSDIPVPSADEVRLIPSLGVRWNG